jgi:hypothetical protein
MSLLLTYNGLKGKIKDTQAILIQDNSIKLFGDGEEMTFNNFPNLL